ncbi:hypothetical protein SAMN04488053_11723, partial [Alkalicoccus daliensis]
MNRAAHMLLQVVDVRKTPQKREVSIARFYVSIADLDVSIA